MTHLTEHFSIEEFERSDVATRKGIDNTIPMSLRINVLHLAHMLEAIRQGCMTPLVISSGYRSPTLNALVGGSLSSAHMQAMAADITSPLYKPRELASRIAALNLPLDQIILEFPDSPNGGWVHIGLSEKDARRELLTINHGTGYMKGFV